MGNIYCAYNNKPFNAQNVLTFEMKSRDILVSGMSRAALK